MSEEMKQVLTDAEKALKTAVAKRAVQTEVDMMITKARDLSAQLGGTEMFLAQMAREGVYLPQMREMISSQRAVLDAVVKSLMTI